MRRAVGQLLLAAVVLAVAAAGCTAEPPRAAPTATTSVAAPQPTRPTHSTGTISSSRSPTPTPTPTARPRTSRFRPAAALATVRHLAGGIGPREATGPAYARAARWVTQRLRRLGFAVHRQSLRVPAGVSWGVPVPAGRTWNVVAVPPGFDSGTAHRVVGAHLDTVPQAPGAEDNASGVAVLLELARMSSRRQTARPTLFVAFGAEEPRGETDLDHHYGSRAYVARLAPAERRALLGMVSLDRVGVGRVVPVCTAGGTPLLVAELAAAARRADVATQPCANRTSDHWSFVRDGLPGIRVGGTSYAAYHSAGDLPAVVNPAQLRRAGRLVWAWLSIPPR